ncbi:MAG: hypothetical protein R3F07_11790 [Opitutaceae bacterium]
MPTPGEHKTVQARILVYAEVVGWTTVSREEAEQRRGFDSALPTAERAKNRSLFFDDLLDATVRELAEHLCNRSMFFDHDDKRERDYFRELFRTLLHELIAAKPRVNHLNLVGSQKPK